MSEKTIGVKELYTSLPAIAKEVQKGTTFIVRRHYTPLFVIMPVQVPKKKKKFDRQDVLQIRSSLKDKNLSQIIDEVVYGS